MQIKKRLLSPLFTTFQPQNYVGPYPDYCQYECDTTSDKDRSEFLTWHQSKINNNEQFDFAKEIVEYCQSHVDILNFEYISNFIFIHYSSHF